MSKYHTVTQGECLSSLAEAYGFLDYQTIYMDAGNTDLRRKRPNPDLLFPGDVVYIPDKREKTVCCDTGRVHWFRVVRKKTFLRIYVYDSDDQPYANKKYVLTVEGASLEGRTTADGLVEQHIPAEARNGQLMVWVEEEGGEPEEPEESIHVFDLLIGSLDPEQEVTGVQARLNNLGFSCGAVDGVSGPKTRAALMEFQKKVGLNPTGEISTEICAKLRELHDSK